MRRKKFDKKQRGDADGDMVVIIKIIFNVDSQSVNYFKV